MTTPSKDGVGARAPEPQCVNAGAGAEKSDDVADERIPLCPIERLRTWLGHVLHHEIGASREREIANHVLMGLIALSVLIIILETDRRIMEAAGEWLLALEWVVVVVFTLEYAARIWTATPAEEHRPRRKLLSRRNRPTDHDGETTASETRADSTASARRRYIFSFWGVVDLLAILPFFLGLFFSFHLAPLRLLRLLRIFLFARYVASFGLFANALRRKRGEILVSIQIVAALTVILSVILFEIESGPQSRGFADVPSALAWSIAKFIDGIGGYGDFDPVTTAGKVVATLIGFLNIAVFAIPAGIVASGFVEEIHARNDEERLEQKRALIEEAFRPIAQPGVEAPLPRKYITKITASSVLEISEKDLMMVLEKTDHLRLRQKKVRPDDHYSSALVIEHYLNNRAYGGYEKRDSAIAVVSACGFVEPSVGHFASSLATLLGATAVINEHFGTERDMHHLRAFDFLTASYEDVEASEAGADRTSAKGTATTEVASERGRRTGAEPTAIDRGRRTEPESTEIDAHKAFTEWRRDLTATAQRSRLVLIVGTHDREPSTVKVSFGSGVERRSGPDTTIHCPLLIEQFLEACDAGLRALHPTASVVSRALPDSHASTLHQFLHGQHESTVLSISIHRDILEWGTEIEYFGALDVISEQVKILFQQEEASRTNRLAIGDDGCLVVLTENPPTYLGRHCGVEAATSTNGSCARLPGHRCRRVA